jgi:hypothetical protein
MRKYEYMLCLCTDFPITHYNNFSHFAVSCSFLSVLTHLCEGYVCMLCLEAPRFFPHPGAFIRRMRGQCVAM